jgi:hypothetical protein
MTVCQAGQLVGGGHFLEPGLIAVDGQAGCQQSDDGDDEANYQVDIQRVAECYIDVKDSTTDILIENNCEIAVIPPLSGG